MVDFVFIAGRIKSWALQQGGYDFWGVQKSNMEKLMYFSIPTKTGEKEKFLYFLFTTKDVQR